MSQWPIAELIPHAADMILIDEVVRFGAEDIETRLTVRPGGLFSQADGSLPAWIGMELMAQSIAAYAGCQARQTKKNRGCCPGRCVWRCRLRLRAHNNAVAHLAHVLGVARDVFGAILFRLRLGKA